ncbi:MAG: amidophosphoribosyltransferase [Actinomycetaceae bacterium]|nr:amidophosphoribosyltransferase [Actinomycetaceae bacterium]
MSGIVGFFNVPSPVKKAFFSLYALQHRGQEACGLYVSDGQKFRGHREVGLVPSVLRMSELDRLSAINPIHAIGQVRSSVAGDPPGLNSEPRHFRHLRAEFAIASTGGLANHPELYKSLQEEGAIFQSTSISEILAHMLVKHRGRMLDALQDSLPRMVGGFSFVVMRRNRLYAIRDPHGIDPLSIAKLGDGYVIASETCAFDLLGAKFIRDVAPGEIVEFMGDEMISHTYGEPHRRAVDLMEFVYTARVDSYIHGVSVYQARYQSGVELARESYVDTDLIVGLPDSSLAGGAGYAAECGVPHGFGLVKNKYSGRSFIEPTPEDRDRAVYLKLSPVRSILEGKSVTLVDDSIVRGTTAKRIIQMVRNAGAREVHMRIASPRMIAPSFYGMNTPTFNELIANQLSTEEIREYVSADSLAFLSIDGLKRAVGLGDDVLDAPWTGNYPTPLFSHTKYVQNEWEDYINRLGDPSEL